MKRISTMKNAVIFSIFFFLMGIVPLTGNQAFAAELGISLLAQNEDSQEYDQAQSEGYESEPYQENEGEYDQEQPEPYQENGGDYGQEQLEPYQENEGEYGQEQLEPYQENEGEYGQEQLEPYQENEGEYDQEQQMPNEPEPYQENDGLIDQEQLEKDEPGPGQDPDVDLQNDLPAPSDLMPDAALSGGSLASPLASGQCDKAAGKVIILLNAAGIHSGTTYIKSEGKVVFSNTAKATHVVTVSPQGILSSNSFKIFPNNKVFMFASSVTQTKHGIIKVNAGKSNETVHDVIICP